MSDLLSRRLILLDAATNLPLLTECLHGIGCECLRIDNDDKLALTPHPRALGSTLTHPQITTDHSETLLEFITPTETDVADTLGDLKYIHRFASSRLDSEYLWNPSVPCGLPGEESTPIARYGSSLVDHLKYVCRKGLALRYGKTMRCIAGIHYGLSLPERLWPLLCRAEGNELSERGYQSVAHIALIRNFRHYSRLLMYLFDTSSALDTGFLHGHPGQLERFDEHTLCLSYATSLRMSGLGYRNNAQAGLTLYYSDLQSYIDSLCQAVSTLYPPYEKVGTKQDGEWTQLDANTLQIENEYCSSIRSEHVTYIGERPVQVLAARGVQYVEMRYLDINPSLPLDINLDKVRFLDTFLLFCAFNDSPLLNGECSDATDNFLAAVKENRWPGLQLQRHGQPVESRVWTNELLERVAGITALLDRARGGETHVAALTAWRAKVVDAELTPSVQVLKAVRERDESFEALSLHQGREHVEYFRQHPLAIGEQARFEKMASDPLTEQMELERDQDGDFDTLVAAYQTSILDLTSNWVEPTRLYTQGRAGESQTPPEYL